MDWTEASATSNTWQLRTIPRSCRAARITFPLLVSCNPAYKYVRSTAVCLRRIGAPIQRPSLRGGLDVLLLGSCPSLPFAPRLLRFELFKLVCFPHAARRSICCLQPSGILRFLGEHEIPTTAVAIYVPRKLHPQLDFFELKAHRNYTGRMLAVLFHTPQLNAQNTAVLLATLPCATLFS